jgi:hypothetical protein
LERGLKPLLNGCLGIIIKINLTTNYQLLLNCNKVHRAGSQWVSLAGQAADFEREVFFLVLGSGWASLAGPSADFE